MNRIQGLVKILIASAASQAVTLPPLPTEQSLAAASDGNNNNNMGSDTENGPAGVNEDEGQDSDPESGPRVKAEPSDPSLAAGITQLGQASKADLLQAPLYLVPLKEAELVQQQVAAAANSMGQGLFLPSRQVSSQGCSRVFIIKGEPFILSNIST